MRVYSGSKNFCQTLSAFEKALTAFIKRKNKDNPVLCRKNMGNAQTKNNTRS